MSWRSRTPDAPVWAMMSSRFLEPRWAAKRVQLREMNHRMSSSAFTFCSLVKLLLLTITRVILCDECDKLHSFSPFQYRLIYDFPLNPNHFYHMHDWDLTKTCLFFWLFQTVTALFTNDSLLELKKWALYLWVLTEKPLCHTHDYDF